MMTSPHLPTPIGTSVGFDDALAALREHFRDASGPMVESFETLAMQLGRTPTSPRALESLRAELHRVKGTAGSYGFTDASALAGKLEERVLAWTRDQSLDLEQRATIIQHFASALRLAFQMPITADQLPTIASGPRRRMVLVGARAETARALDTIAATRGYTIEAMTEQAWSARDPGAPAPHLLVVARAGTAGASSGRNGHWLPTLDIDESNAATNPDRLFDRADRLLVSTTWLRPTVLLLDDDPSILEIARYALGADVRVVTIDNPQHIFETLDREQPVVLLFEARLPSFNAITFARTLRAMPAHRDLPVLLLGERLDSATRLAAYDAGVDETLTKPLIPLELRARVAQRLERLRVERLASGVHAMTAIALPSRASEAVTEYRKLLQAGRRATSVLVRPRLSSSDTAHITLWLRESRRITRAMGATARFAAYREDLSLLLVLDAPEPLATRLLDSLSRNKPGEAPDWDTVIDRGGGPESVMKD
jgi:DNA-binding response OmpR family regulator